MANPAIAQLIADNAATLPHPDGVTTRLAEFNTSQLSPQQAESIRPDLNKRTRRIGESIVHLVETNGYAIISADELTELRNRVHHLGAVEPITIRCNQVHCGEALFTIRPNQPGIITTNGPALINHLAHRDPICPHGPL